MTLDLEKQTRRRIRVLMLFFLMLFLGISVRLFYLQIIRYGFFKEKTIAQQQKSIKLAANRGTIFDRNHKVLATSIETLSLYAAPKYIRDKNALAEKIAPLLKVPAATVLARITNDRYFVWLQRKMDPKAAEIIKQKNIPGIGFIPEQKRIYPRQAYAAHLLGFVGIDDIGLGGIEQFFDKDLGGEPGQLIVDKTPYGDEIYCGVRTIRQKVDGASIELTIDEFIQFTAEKALKKAVNEWKAKAGSIIVMDPRTGEVLAMACVPDFDPNDYSMVPGSFRINTTVQTVYEPGSTLKPLTLAAAYNEGTISDETRIFNGSTYKVDDKTINDYHAQKTMDLQTSFSPESILVYSLNIGITKIGQMLGKEKLYKYLTGFGLGRKTGIELPGESAGLLRSPAKWEKTDEAMIPFGQAVAVTPIQMITAVNVFANKGTMVKPTLVRRLLAANGKVIYENCPPHIGQQVIAPPIAEKVLKIMQEAVDQGTGIAARIPGYTVAGKTGTAEKAYSFGGGYIPNEYISSFVGLVPVEQPKLVILVVLDTPRRGEFGGVVAAPAFKEVAEAALYYMNIPPDRKRS
jgi:cell division protein FtsI (penicillin-binding protein 3)